MKKDTRPPLVIWLSTGSRQYAKLLGRLARNNGFRTTYMVACLTLLLASTIVWSLLGARLQLHNADQLSDPYLFSSWQTFHHATFPGAHTFLLKWPIFWLTTLGGLTAAHVVAATVFEVVITIAVLILVLSKIEKRPLVFGTLCLALATVLLLVPAQPYAGGILPVNMAMLTTRNLEYAVYLTALVLFAKSRRWRSWQFIAAIAALAVLIASDKLFLSLSAGGALLSLIMYALWSNWKLVSFSVRWLVGSLVAGAIATALLAGIAALKVTNFSASASANPYGLVNNAKDIALAVVYAVLGFFTNTGANPAYDNQILRQLPGSLAHRLWSISGITYVAAFLLTLIAAVLVVRLLVRNIRKLPGNTKLSSSNLLALSLIWSTVAAFAVFIATKHDYQVDARYLTIGLFTLVICVAVELRRHKWQWPEDLLLFASALVVCLGIATYTSFHVTNQQNAAISSLAQRDNTIAQALNHHKVDTLVGDYWRVLPIKLASHNSIQAMPLANCTQPVSSLSSTVWQPNLAQHSFAYLVTLNGSLTNFPHCSLAQITAAYGRPNATQIIAGSYTKPDEALLFYDQGSHPPRAAVKVAPALVLPVGLSDIQNTNCQQPTVMNVVAHEDDDLLFLSPNLLHTLDSGKCIRTVFMTAGDGGHGQFYWLGRQLGSEAAYSTMLGIPNAWDQQTVTIAPHEYVTIATPHASTKVSLVFFNLPDGNLHGNGFPNSNSESLAKLSDGNITTLTTVDKQSSYSKSELTSALATIMNLYQPAEIHTQADVPSAQYPDHSDHIATGKLALSAALEYDQNHFGGALQIPVTRYIGYPVHGYPANLSADDLSRKEAAFLAYAQYDGAVCHSLAQCSQTTTYGSYISRQYTEDAAEE